MRVKCVAAGDMLVQRRLPGAYEGFEALSAYIRKGDFRFFNLETTLHRQALYGSQYNGGSYLAADPNTISDIRAFGFNILSPNNNHSMDFSYEGLLKTRDNLLSADFPFAGIGRNLDEAAAPAYLDTLGGRFALISACSTFTPAAMAGRQNARFPGRPGINGLRVSETLLVTQEQLSVLREVAEGTMVNGRQDIMRREGYLPPLPEGTVRMGTLNFQRAEKQGKHTEVVPEDVQRVKRAIYEAQEQADYIVVSVHSHEVGGIDKEEPAAFLVDFAHQCIDAGAHAVVGTGPHLLRPVEIYKGCPIFYSLGDFILQNENIQMAPADMFSDYGVPEDSTMRDMFATRSKNHTRGLQSDHRMFESVVPYWEAEDGKLTYLKLLPIELGFGLPRSRNGWPRICHTANILERLQKMSAPYGTEIDAETGEVRLR